MLLTNGVGQNTVAHELTHGFQDWSDVSGKTNDIEADAWIVEALVVSKLAPSEFAKLDDPFSKAAKFILKDRGSSAKFGNKAWGAVYKAASDFYESIRVAALQPVTQDWSAGETFNEKKYLQGLIGQVK